MSDFSSTGDLTWGDLEDTEIYGRKVEAQDSIQLEKEEMKTKYKPKIEASHCLLYAKNDKKIFDIYNPRAVVLMQMRFDGYIGFPGGLVDPDEDDVYSLNRELKEEINLDLDKYSLSPSNYVISHYNKKTGIGTHFYAKEVTMEELKSIEINSLTAEDYGTEVLGTVRIPLYTMGDGYRGFPVFLKNQFIGNSKQQLIYTLKKLNLMTEDEIQRALNATQ